MSKVLLIDVLLMSKFDEIIAGQIELALIPEIEKFMNLIERHGFDL